MTVLVTGGAGFIGSNFVFYMLEKYPFDRIICLDKLTYAGNLSTLSPVMDKVNFPAEVVPLVIVKMFSSSAATGLLTDIYKRFGTDSAEGYLASLIMCCSETIFYTISVYFMATGDKDRKPVTGIRWTLAGALLCTLAGTVASVLLCR